MIIVSKAGMPGYADWRAFALYRWQPADHHRGNPPALREQFAFI